MIPGMNEHNDSTTLLTFADAGKLLPESRSGQTVWRWARRGTPTRSGHRVHLQYLQLGRRFYTTMKWVAEYGDELARNDRIVEASNAVPVADHAVADRRLQESGL